MVERLDDDLTRSLQNMDPHGSDYLERLQDEQTLYNKILRTQLYMESLSEIQKLDLPQDNQNRVMIRRVEKLYFKVSFETDSYTTMLNRSSLHKS